jgi:hypothetical protein
MHTPFYIFLRWPFCAGRSPLPASTCICLFICGRGCNHGKFCVSVHISVCICVQTCGTRVYTFVYKHAIVYKHVYTCMYTWSLFVSFSFRNFVYRVCSVCAQTRGTHVYTFDLCTNMWYTCVPICVQTCNCIQTCVHMYVHMITSRLVALSSFCVSCLQRERYCYRFYCVLPEDVYPAQIFYKDYEYSASDGNASSESENFKRRSLCTFNQNVRNLVSVMKCPVFVSEYPYPCISGQQQMWTMTNRGLRPGADPHEANRRYTRMYTHVYVHSLLPIVYINVVHNCVVQFCTQLCTTGPSFPEEDCAWP